MGTTYKEEFIQSVPSYASQADAFLLEKTIDFEGNGRGLVKDDVLYLFDVAGLCVHNVMWKWEGLDKAVSVSVGGKATAGLWASAATCAAATAATPGGARLGGRNASGWTIPRIYAQTSTEAVTLKIASVPDVMPTKGKLTVKAVVTRL